ncbi:MAG TPA: sensor histidine kinase [Polyangiales bacterium]
MRAFVLWALLWTASTAQAQLFDVNRLQGSSAVYPEWVEDESRTATFEQIRTRSFASQEQQDFARGFTHNVYWLRFKVENQGADPQEWLLELAYPHLDHVELFDSDGRHWVTGDMLPFKTRPLAHAHFVFPLATRAHQTTEVYLRLQTGGALRAPLRLWKQTDFAVQENHDNLLLWMFYGAMALLAGYNFAVAFVLRRREHAYYGMMLLGVGSSIFTLSGSTAQYVLPNHPLWANRTLALSIAWAWLGINLFTHTVTIDVGIYKVESRLYRMFTPAAWLAIAIAVFSPPDVGLRAVLVMTAIYLPCAFWLLRSNMARKDPRLHLYQVSWYCYIIAIPTTFAAHANWIPQWPIALWAAHIGCVAHGVFTSLALPARVNELSARLERLNAQLSANVSDLKLALARAEEATLEAQRATKVKGEFMATMSHELRTPLNAIINVPQGLLEDFPLIRTATCEACSVRYLLEPDEQLPPDVRCEACGRENTLRVKEALAYTGDPAHTVRFLHKIERSGKHLLQMVNGVLDFSKMEAGRLQLTVSEIDLHALLVEAIDEMTDLAERKQLRVALEVPSARSPVKADWVRLKQVLLNLLSNAIKFSEPNTVITVHWQREEHYDMVSVTDQGIGIKREDQERVFASFEQVHKGDTRKYGGTGLGLSISRSLVRMHGGELNVRSEFGKGATFSFTIPRLGLGRMASEPLQRAV